MDKYSQYFLYNILKLSDGYCDYYLLENNRSPVEILDVPSIVFESNWHVRQWIKLCMEYNEHSTQSQLRSFLSDRCSGSIPAQMLTNQNVLREAANHIFENSYRLVVKPLSGVSIRTYDLHTGPTISARTLPDPMIEPEIEKLLELIHEIVDEQEKKTKKLERELSRMTPNERESYARNRKLKASGEVVKNSIVSFFEHYGKYLKKNWKYIMYGPILGPPIKTLDWLLKTDKEGPGNMAEDVFNKVAKNVEMTHEQYLVCKLVVTTILSHERVREVLVSFAEWYWDALHPIERDELKLKTATHVLIIIVQAVIIIVVSKNIGAIAGALRLERLGKLLIEISIKIQNMGSDCMGAGVDALRAVLKKFNKSKNKSGRFRNPKRDGNPNDDVPKTTPKKKDVKKEDESNEGLYRHTSARLGSPTKGEIKKLRKEFSGLDSDSEASAYWYVDKQKSTKSIIPGETNIKKELGIDPKAPKEKMVDLLKKDNNGKLVPIEVKNENEMFLVGKGNSAFGKFKNIADNTNMKEVSHFEVMGNLDSKLPPNFKIDKKTGKLYELYSGSSPPKWDAVDFGGKNVYVRTADLGEISK